MKTNKHTIQPVDTQSSFPEREEAILSYWKEQNIFEKSINGRKDAPSWTFLDGPPFITGLPHYGTLLSSIPKDVFPRYYTMKGFKVRRVWGWDCHGLPAENKVETEYKIKRKKDIEEKLGVAKFIAACKAYVNNVSGEWEWYVDHIARWVDFKNAYRTMDTEYMETVMWVFKSMYDKGHIYKGLRVSLYCPHCSTPISNFEVAMDSDNYKEITERATTYKYKMVGEDDTYILAWSTTPWNKIATPALAVNPKMTYVKVKQGREKYILVNTRLSMLTDTPYEILEEFKGTKLLGKSFEPHYDFYAIDPGKKAFIIIGGDFVTDTEGTGVVTIAAYGEEDLAVMQKENIQIVKHVDDEGKLTSDVPKWAGLYYLDVNPLVDEDLASRGLLYRDDPIVHTVPTCWRCHTRLIYAPQDAWYVNIQDMKPKLKKTNENVSWYPKHFKYGRYLKSLESAPDWCISRSRYWGSPVPVWECECGERFVPGSIEELEKASGQKITDLHKPEIDDVIVKCAKCGNTNVRRVPEVLDSWIEAGSASFAERHFPFNKDVKLDEFFPPDFIVEYTGQIRAWFYVLHVISTALYDSHAFKNVVVTGVILGTDGRKMSKNYGNYPDPKDLIQKYGGDALRLYLLGSPVMHAEDIRISEEDYRNQVRGALLVLWNTYNFFVTYISVDGVTEFSDVELKKVSVMDRWILSLLSKLTTDLTVSLDAYDTVKAVDEVKAFINEFSTWYIRRSRDRIGPGAENEVSKKSFYDTCYFVLTTLSRLTAPIIPFASEAMFRNLTGLQSVHLEHWPDARKNHRDADLEAGMSLARKIVEKAHAARKVSGIKVRQPLASLSVTGLENAGEHAESNVLTPEILQIIKEEVNVKDILFDGRSNSFDVTLDTQITPELAAEGKMRDLMRQIQQLRKEKKLEVSQKVDVTIPNVYADLPENLLEKVRKDTLVGTIVWGEEFSLSTG